MAEMEKGSLERAMEAATRINALLVAKGLAKPEALTPKAKLLDTGIYSAELDINDLPEACRSTLLLDQTRGEITRLTNATVTVRGQLVAQDQRKKAGVVPLTLCVNGPTQYSVDGALRKIDQVIASAPQNRPSTANNAGASTQLTASSVPAATERVVAPRPTGSFVQEKVYVGLDSAPAEFELRSRLLGPSRMYLKHIQAETNALVVLRGRGSGTIEPESGREAYEPLHIYVAHPSVGGLAHAKELALNLIQTIHADYHSWTERQKVLVSSHESSSTPLSSTNAGLSKESGGDADTRLNTPGGAEPGTYVSLATTEYLKRFKLQTVASAPDEKPKSWPVNSTAARPTPPGFYPDYTPNYPAPPPHSSLRPTSGPANDQYRAAYELYASMHAQTQAESNAGLQRSNAVPKELPVNNSAEMPSLVLYPIYALAQSAAASAHAAPRDDSCVQPPLNPPPVRNTNVDESSVLRHQPKVPLAREFVTRTFHSASTTAPLSTVRLGGIQPPVSQSDAAETGRRKPRRFMESKVSDAAEVASSSLSNASESVVRTQPHDNQPARNSSKDQEKLQPNAVEKQVHAFAEPVAFARPQAPVKRNADKDDTPTTSNQKKSCLDTNSYGSASRGRDYEHHAPLSSSLKILNAYTDDSDEDI